MRKPSKVDPTDPVALTAWLAETRALTADLHTLTLDATARKGQRYHSKSYLREQERVIPRVTNLLLGGARRALDDL